MKKYFVCCLFILMLFMACKERNSNDVLFKKTAAQKEDATTTNLRQLKNYQSDPKYFEVFNNYYNNKINSKDYTAATNVLEIVTMKCVFHYDFFPDFLQTIISFDKKYRDKLPVLKTTFIDTYLANYYYDKGDLKKSIAYFKKITLYEPTDYKSCNNIARAYYELSYVYFNVGKQDLSLKANLKAASYYKKINNYEGLGSVYSNYANIYKAIGDQKKAIESTDKAVKAFTIADNKYDRYMSVYNKICIYDYVQDSKRLRLIDSIYLDFKYSKYKNNTLLIAFSNLKADQLIDENKLAEAKTILEEIAPIVKNVNSENWTQDYDATVAKYEIKKNPNNFDITAIQKTVPFLVTNEQYEKADQFYNVLKNHAIQIKDFKTALIYEEEKQIIRDSIGNIYARGKIAELETKYQTKKKEQQITIQKATILNKNTTIALLLALFIGMFLTVVVYITLQKQKKLKLEKLNAQQYTKQLLEKTEEERKRIACDLHDSVSHELLSLKNSFELKTDITNNKIDAIINDIRIISRNLHPIMFDKIGLKASVEQLIERTQSVNDFMVTADINYTSFLSSNDELQLYRIIQEALSNIIKYANAVAAKITINEINNILFIEIKDNGKGFNVAAKLHGKNAFGLHNIIERSRAIGGEANIISDKNGTVITIDIKK